MKRCTSKLILFAFEVAVLFQSGCAYFKPSESESQYLQEQKEMREEQDYRNSGVGCLIESGAQAAADGIKSLNGQK
jgi:hypothetical protein